MSKRTYGQVVHSRDYRPPTDATGVPYTDTYPLPTPTGGNQQDTPIPEPYKTEYKPEPIKTTSYQTQLPTPTPVEQKQVTTPSTSVGGTMEMDFGQFNDSIANIQSLAERLQRGENVRYDLGQAVGSFQRLAGQMNRADFAKRTLSNLVDRYPAMMNAGTTPLQETIPPTFEDTRFAGSQGSQLSWRQANLLPISEQWNAATGRSDFMWNVSGYPVPLSQAVQQYSTGQVKLPTWMANDNRFGQSFNLISRLIKTRGLNDQHVQRLIAGLGQKIKDAWFAYNPAVVSRTGSSAA